MSERESFLLVAGGTDEEVRSVLSVARALSLSHSRHVTLLAPERFRPLALGLCAVKRFLTLDFDAASLVWDSAPLTRKKGKDNASVSVQVDDGWVHGVAERLERLLSDDALDRLWSAGSQSAWLLDSDTPPSTSSSSKESLWRVCAVLSSSLRVLMALSSSLAERLGVPLIALQWAPLIPTSEFPHPYAPPIPIPFPLPWLSEARRNRLSHAFARHLGQEAEARFDQVRETHGTLGPLRDAHVYAYVECTWSDAVLARPSDWPSHTRLVGLPYPLADPLSQSTCLSQIQIPLSPFVILALETAPTALWFALSSALTRVAKERGLDLLVLLALDDPHPLPLTEVEEHVHVYTVPSSAVLRRAVLKSCSSSSTCVAIVHDGSLAAHRDAWAHSVPSLPVPLFDDQRYWARVLSARGLSLSPLDLGHLGDASQWRAVLNPSALSAVSLRVAQWRRDEGALTLSSDHCAELAVARRLVALTASDELKRGLGTPPRERPHTWISPSAQRWLQRSAIVAGIFGVARLYSEVAFVDL